MILNTHSNTENVIPISFTTNKEKYPFIQKDFAILFHPHTSLDYFIAATIVIHFDQIMTFQDSFDKMVHNQNVPGNLAVFRPFFEEKTQIIRILGRVQDSNFASGKFQILLGYKSILARKLIYNLHIQFFCTGLKYIVHTIRQEFWVPKIRKFTDKIIHTCIVCHPVKVKK